MPAQRPKISIVLPAKNEAGSPAPLIEELRAYIPGAEILYIDDGSDDETGRLAIDPGVKIITHAYSHVNGAPINAGARAAAGDILVFMDVDGQHDPADILC